MMKPDVKIENWSSRRDLERGEVVMVRTSEIERTMLIDIAAELRVRPTDVVRGALIYAGVWPAPPPEQQTADGSAFDLPPTTGPTKTTGETDEATVPASDDPSCVSPNRPGNAEQTHGSRTDGTTSTNGGAE